MIALRDYQRAAIDAVESAYARGVRRQLVVLPTGTGKTVVFSEIARRRAASPTLILAHRDELLGQAREKLATVAPELGMSIGLVKARYNDVNHPVVIGSVQTLARKSRREQLPTNFGTVIVDEAHHVAADSYQAILDHVDADLVVGATATPKRHDGRSLEDSFDEMVFARSPEEMIRAGYLAPPRGKRIDTAVDLDAVKKSRGDFQASALADALEEADVPAEVLSAYNDHGEGRKGLIFAPTVAMAHHLAEVFRDDGIACEALDGETPEPERAAILERLSSGETQLVANVGVLTEGFDEPSLSCIILAAPTRSEVKYQQIVGRGLRLYPGKADCLVLDVVGASDDKSIMSLPVLFGLGADEMHDGETVIEARERMEREQAARDREAVAERDAAQQRVAERRERNQRAIRFFDRASMAWSQHGDRWSIPYRVRNTEEERITETIALMPTDGRYDVVLVTQARSHADKAQVRNAVRYIARDLDLGYAQGAAEEAIRAKGHRLLASKAAAWRDEPATPGQRRYMGRLRIKASPDMTRGEASDAIERATMSETLERASTALAQADETTTDNRTMEEAAAV